MNLQADFMFIVHFMECMLNLKIQSTESRNQIPTLDQIDAFIIWEIHDLN